MGLIYLVDTNIVSEILRPHPNPQVQHFWGAYQGHMGISATTWHELIFGLHRMPESRRKRAIQSFLFDMVKDVMPIFPYDEMAAVWFARERVRLTNIGQTPSYADGQIAAVSATNNLTLVTNNERDFANFSGLVIENWFDLRVS